MTVLEDGFEYEGTHYRSLTKVAMAVTGYGAISGPAFFRITEPKDAPPKAPKQKRERTQKAATSESTPAEDATATN